MCVCLCLCFFFFFSFNSVDCSLDDALTCFVLVRQKPYYFPCPLAVMSEPIHMRENEWAKAHQSIITTALFRKLPRNGIQFPDNRLNVISSLLNMIYRVNAKYVMNLRYMKSYITDVITVHEAEQISASELIQYVPSCNNNCNFM